jgi:transcriptional regulator with XRE-family HTH domain
VGRNLARIRAEEGLTLRDVSERMPTDHPMRFVAVGEIERGERRVTVDDLTALAAALGISPLTLLMPFTRSAKKPDVQLVGTPSTMPSTMLLWLLGRVPVGNPFKNTEDFARRAIPSWALTWKGHPDAEE